MKIYFTDQKNELKKHLELLKEKQVTAYDKNNLREKVSVAGLATTKYIDQLDLSFLFDYAIFPDNIMIFKSQWQDEKRKMKIGDTIAQQAYLPPTRVFSQKIIFGVRINEIIDQSDRKGFSYETLEGHVEKGISTFILEQV